MPEIDAWGYDLDKYPVNYFEYFVDIGGCQGEISFRIAEKHPNTQIFCYEPSDKDYAFIQNRLSAYGNMTIINEALGNGQDLRFNEVQMGAHYFLLDNGSYSKPSRTLADILVRNGIPRGSRYGLKIDCEGGERFLIGDRDSEDAIRNSQHLAMEVHFPPTTDKYKWLKAFPKWSIYNDWIHREFASTHDIKYSRSDRRSGRGVYALTSKKFQEECDEE